MSDFKNAVIIGQHIPLSAYLGQVHKRGDAGYVMSQSDLMNFSRCPHRWLAGYIGPTSEAKEWGTLVDTLLLSPSEFGKTFALIPTTYEGERGEKPWNFNATVCKKWRERFGFGAGKIEVRQLDYDAARAATDLLRADYDTGCLLENARVQVMVTGTYEDKETGLSIPCKALLDIVPDAGSRAYGRCLCDLKTSADASPDKWGRTVFNFGWHVQAAFHMDLFVAATGEDRTDWLHLIQENFEPYEIGRRLIASEFVEMGRTEYRGALRQYAQCLKSGEWPTYDEMGPNIMPGWSLICPEDWMLEKTMLRLPAIRPIETELAKPAQMSEVPS